MSLFTWLGIHWTNSRPVGASAPPRRTCRLQVEPLEDRAVPASYNAATVPELIDAMNAANLTAEADTITLVAGTRYTLTEVNNTADGANGLPVIAANEDLTILGNGSVIERSTATGTPAFRLFDVAAGAALTLENMTLQGGLAFGSGEAASGGAIYSQGTLELNTVTVQNNRALGSRGWNASYTISRGGDPIVFPASSGQAAYGGGFYIGGGTAMLTGVILVSNTVQGGAGGDGLNVHFGGNSRLESGRLTVPPGDGGAGFGGGLYAAGGAITLRNASVATNNALGGAAGKGTGGSAGLGIGGGVYFESDVLAVLDAFTVSHFRRNKASTSDPNIAGQFTLVS